MSQFDIKECKYTGVGLVTEERGKSFTSQHATTPYGVVRILKWHASGQTPKTTLITTHDGAEYRANIDAVYSDQYTKTLARRFAWQVFDKHCQWWRDRLDAAAAKEGAFVEKLRADHAEAVRVAEERTSVAIDRIAERDEMAKALIGVRRDCCELLSILLNLRWDEDAHCFKQVDRLAAKYLKPEPPK